ncbi:MAG: hypothetical protein V4510_05175 [bacterium]
MPKPKATREAVASKTRKQAAIGSGRKEAKAAASSRPAKRATGIHANDRTAAYQATVHAKKTPPARRPGPGQVAVGTPNVPGYSNFVDAEKYAAMKDVLLAVVPAKAPGITQGEMFEAVRAKASRAKFPGSTERWWAKCVQLDLEAKGVLRRVDGTPLRWHRT